MDLNKFTDKSQEALRIAQEIAIAKNQAQVDASHLFYALISQEGSIVPIIIKKLGTDQESLKFQAMREIDKQPKISDAPMTQLFITPETLIVLNTAAQEGNKIGDEYAFDRTYFSRFFAHQYEN